MLNKNVVIVDAKRYQELIGLERWANALELAIEEIEAGGHLYPRANNIYEEIVKEESKIEE